MMIFSHAWPKKERAAFKTPALATVSINPRDSAIDTNPTPVSCSHIRGPRSTLSVYVVGLTRSDVTSAGLESASVCGETESEEGKELCDIRSEECDVLEVM